MPGQCRGIAHVEMLRYLDEDKHFRRKKLSMIAIIKSKPKQRTSSSSTFSVLSPMKGYGLCAHGQYALGQFIHYQRNGNVIALIKTWPL